MDKKRKQVIAQNEISTIYTFTLGGVDQKVLIEGKSRDLPVVITLHGGPGSPAPFSVGCRGMFPEFTDRFIMVYWDQLGCGINDCKLKDKYGTEDFARMTIDLVTEVRKLFPQNKILLFGTSWGSVLALKASAAAAQDIHAVVVWGQVVRNLFLNDVVYNALDAHLSEKKMKRVRGVTAENFTNSDMMFISTSIRKYTDGYTNRSGRQVSMGPIIKGLMSSPDYRFRDFKAMMMNGTMTSTRLWPELLKIDLSDELAKVQVPYFILQGNTDIVTPTAFVSAIAESAENANLRLSIIEKSGHQPGEEGLQAVLQTLESAAAEE